MIKLIIEFSLAALLLITGCSVKETDKVQSELPSQAPTGSASVSNDLTGKDIPYKVSVFAQGLEAPWELAFAPDGRIFITERPGRIRVIKNDKLVDKPVFSFSPPFISKGEGGLLGLVIDPAFRDNPYLYTYHSYEMNGKTYNRVLRLKVTGDEAVLDKVLIDDIPGDTNHNGGRLKIGPDGLLYVTAGDRYEPPLAQKQDSLGGKILRIGLDGTIPANNPFPGSPVYSMGHRNPQGLAWHPETGQLYASEHGQTSKDEINLIIAGANYGWPTIEGDQRGTGDKRNLKIPLIHSGTSTWAPSGMTFVTQGPWKNQLLVANLRGTQLLKLSLNSPEYDSINKVETYFKDVIGRIRNVSEGPDGSLYILTNNRDGRGTPEAADDRIIKLLPIP